MNIHADKTSENKNRSQANAVFEKQSSDESAFEFEDNRTEVITRRKQQEIINNCPRVKQLRTYQAMADSFTSQTAQRKEKLEEETLQGKFEPIQRKENNTGLPDNLKLGIENLSGYAMDDVKVHYNSSQPAQLSALAYAQGTDIHVASGQEQHLPHEVWHVVQQAQGRVQTTKQMKGGVNVNDDLGLENEADLMGAKAVSVGLVQKKVIESDSIDSRSKVIQACGLQDSVSPELFQSIQPDKVSNTGTFMQNQAEYQNQLVSKFGEAIIMRHHKSVGFEFEFANYINGQENQEIPSHVLLANSGPFSNLFPINFELETDAGKVLEIGMAPVLVPNIKNKPDKGGISTVYTGLRAKMKVIREEYQNEKVTEVVKGIEKEGLGSKWTRQQNYPNLIMSDKKGVATKLDNAEDKIYSQANISMNAEESAQIINAMMNDKNQGTADKGVLGGVAGELFKRLQPLCQENEAGDIAAIHISKSLANILSIPSILRKELKLTMPDAYDLESIVKELYGVWVKDSLNETLTTSIYLNNPNRFDELIAPCINYMKEQIIEAAKVISKNNQPFVPKSNELSTLEKLNQYAAKDQGIQSVIDDKIYGSNFEQVLTKYQQKDLFKVQVSIMKTELEKDGQENHKWDTFYEAEKEAIRIFNVMLETEQKLKEAQLQEEKKSIEKNLDIVQKIMLDEMHSMIESIKGNVKQKPVKVSYGKGEQFGSGHGVRKDTHIKSNGETNVAELRSGYVIDKYLK